MTAATLRSTMPLRRGPWSYAIVSGPSREELFDALRLSEENRKVKLVITYCKPGEVGAEVEILVYIDQIGRANNFGSAWVFHATLGDQPLIGSYNTQKRLGTIAPS